MIGNTFCFIYLRSLGFLMAFKRSWDKFVATHILLTRSFINQPRQFSSSSKAFSHHSLSVPSFPGRFSPCRMAWCDSGVVPTFISIPDGISGIYSSWHSPAVPVVNHVEHMDQAGGAEGMRTQLDYGNERKNLLQIHTQTNAQSPTPTRGTQQTTQLPTTPNAHGKD
jgi:hypothetical protein